MEAKTRRRLEDGQAYCATVGLHFNYVHWNMPRRVTALCVTPAGEAGLHGPARSETDEVRRRTLRSLCAACNAHRRRSGTAGGVAMMSAQRLSP